MTRVLIGRSSVLCRSTDVRSNFEFCFGNENEKKTSYHSATNINSTDSHEGHCCINSSIRIKKRKFIASCAN